MGLQLELLCCGSADVDIDLLRSRTKYALLESATYLSLRSMIRLRTATHHSPLTACHLPLATHHSPLTTHHSPLTTHHSPLPTHHSPLATHRSPLTACHRYGVGVSPNQRHVRYFWTAMRRSTPEHYLLLTTYYLPPTTHYSLLPTA